MDLARSLDEDDSDSAALQVAVLSFLNALINYKAGEVQYIIHYINEQERYSTSCTILMSRRGTVHHALY